MPVQAYVNGRWYPHRDAQVHIEDRGYQFADGVYEVVTIFAGNPVDEEAHLDRLDRSLFELRIGWPVSRRVLALLLKELVARNRLRNGLIYIQVTRGVARRDHKFPQVPVKPALVMTARPIDIIRDPKFDDGVKVVTIPDIRWERCDIKSISLLPNCLGKQTAFEAGAYEAWQVDREGYISEGTSSNAWIVTPAGELLTRPTGHEILRGVTRQTILAIAEEQGLTYREKKFTVEEAKMAREAFVTSATSFVTPVVQIDDAVVANGKPGTLSCGLLEAYLRYSANAS